MTSSTEDAGLASFAGAWTLDPARTSVAFRTKAMWVLNVTGTVKVISGSARVADDGALTAIIVLDATSVNTNNAKRDAHLRTGDFFDASTYPTMTFTASAGRLAGAGHVDIAGELAIRDQIQALAVPATYVATGDTVDITAELVVDRSQWGLRWAKMGAGLINNLKIDAVFVKAES